MSNKLIITIGLPRSGKSTWSQLQKCPIVNPDSIRLALHGEAYIRSAEPYVWAITETMIRSLFMAGNDTVILDAANVSQERRDAWKSSLWIREFIVFDTPKEVCLDRARGNENLTKVIERMSLNWENISDLELEDSDTVRYIKL